MAKLIVVLPGQPETSHELSGNTVTIGRLPDNTIPLPDGSISGHHAKIVMVNGAWLVTDLDSMNKTWVRGVAIREAPLAGEVPLRFGSVHCTFIEGKTRIEELQEQIEALKKQIPAASKLPKAAILNPAKELDAQAMQMKLLKAERDELATQIKAQLDLERKKNAELAAQAASTHENQKQVSAILSDTRKQLERALAERDALRKEHAGLAAKFEAEKAARGEVAGKAQTTEKEQAQLAATLAETKKQLEQAVAERDAARKQNDTLAARIETEKAARSEVSGKAQVTEKEQAQLAAKLAETKQQLEQAAAERDTLRKQSNDLAARLEAEKAAKGEVTGKAQATEKEQAQLSATLAETKKQLEQAVAERDTLRKERADLATRLEAEKSAQSAVSGKVQATEKEQARLSGALAETKKQLDQAVAERDDLRKQSNDLATRLEAEKAGQSTAAGRIETAEKEQARLAGELAGMRKQLDQTVAGHDALRKESDALATRLEAEKNAKATLADKAAAVEKEQSRLLAELAEARKQSGAVAAERDAVRKEHEEISKRLAATEEQLASAASRHSASEQRLDGIGKELQTAHADLEHARQELLHLRKERDEIAEGKLVDEQRIQSLEEELCKAQAAAETSASEQGAALEKELRTLRLEKEDLAARLDAELRKTSVLARDNASAHQDKDQLALKLEEAQAQIVDLQSRQTELTTELTTVTTRHPEIGSILSGLPQVTAWLHGASHERGGIPGSAARGSAVIAPPQKSAPSKMTGAPNGSSKLRPRTSPPLSRQALQKAGMDGIAAMRGFIHHLVRHPDDVNPLHDFVTQARDLVEKHEGIHEFIPIVELASLLEALASNLGEQPGRVETRVLRSLIQGVDTLSLLLDAATRKRVASGALMQVLMLGCDPQENSPLVGSLADAGFDTEFEPDLATGLATLGEGKTGLVCFDSARLGGDTTALCGSLKTGLAPSHPPLLLIAESSPVAEWARWSAAGVADFLMKPVHPQELNLKALSLVYRAAMGGK